MAKHRASCRRKAKKKWRRFNCKESLTGKEKSLEIIEPPQQQAQPEIDGENMMLHRQHPTNSNISNRDQLIHC